MSHVVGMPAQSDAPASGHAGSEGLSIIRIRDPNEALGLAARLLAGEAPFRDLPVGASIGSLIAAIDREAYVFARRGDRVVGVVTWAFTTMDTAEAWAFERSRFDPSLISEEGEALIVTGMQAVDTSVTRFLISSLRDHLMKEAQVAYYIRDYGGRSGKRNRVVRLVRPRVRRR
jgi:hemolysin-activating ACP:hemolysin acyltransferase